MSYPCSFSAVIGNCNSIALMAAFHVIRVGMTCIRFIYMCPDYIFTFVKQDIYMITYQEPFFRCSVVACRLSDKFTVSQHLCRNPLIYARSGMLQIVTKQKRGNHIVSRKIRNDFYCFTVHFFSFSHFATSKFSKMLGSSYSQSSFSKSGIGIFLPPSMAERCAQIPVAVQ